MISRKEPSINWNIVARTLLAGQLAEDVRLHSDAMGKKRPRWTEEASLSTPGTLQLFCFAKERALWRTGCRMQPHADKCSAGDWIAAEDGPPLRKQNCVAPCLSELRSSLKLMISAQWSSTEQRAADARKTTFPSTLSDGPGNGGGFCAFPLVPGRQGGWFRVWQAHFQVPAPAKWGEAMSLALDDSQWPEHLAPLKVSREDRAFQRRSAACRWGWGPLSFGEDPVVCKRLAFSYKFSYSWVHNLRCPNWGKIPKF